MRKWLAGVDWDWVLLVMTGAVLWVGLLLGVFTDGY